MLHVLGEWVMDISCYVLADTIVNSTEHGVRILLDGMKVSFV